MAQEKDFRKWLDLYFKHYGLELFVFGCLIIVFISYVVGSSINHSRANYWLKVVSPKLK